MKLSELTTPYENRSVIEYGANGNNAVRHWYPMRHVAGPLYMTEPKPDDWGTLSFDLYLFYPGVPCGGLYYKDCSCDHDYDTEQLLDGVREMGVDTPEGFVAVADRKMQTGSFIGNAVIEFVRQWNPARADIYTKYRVEFYERKRREQAERDAAAAAAEAEEKQKQREKAAAARALYLGWADAMTPLGFGKMHKAMEALIRTDGVVRTRRDFVIWCVGQGYAPEQRDGVTSWRKRYGEYVETKPRTEYHLSTDEDGAKIGYQVSKTEFAFAKYLTEHSERLKEGNHGTA